MSKCIASICILLLAGCTQTRDRIPETAMTQQPSGKVVVYQLMTRLFGNTQTANQPYGTREVNGVGKFSHINETALSGIRELGVTHIWYTGVLEHATLSDYSAMGIPADHPDIVKGRAGSPYAIRDYYDIDPDLADQPGQRMKEFEDLIRRTHDAGLKAIIDFVPNHVARSYRSDLKPVGVADLGENDDVSRPFSPSNNFYYLPGQRFQSPSNYTSLGAANPFPSNGKAYEEFPAKVTGNDQFVPNPSVYEWYETVKLNYGVDIQGGRKTYFEPVPDTWGKMKDILIFWSGKGVDGFRCDMAEMVPVEFWNWVIPQVRALYPDVLFIAEIYNPREYRRYIDQGRFDFLYDKVQLYDTLRDLLRQHGSAAYIHHIQQELADIDRHLVHFMENHDEQRLASPQLLGDPWKACPAMVVSATIDRGAVMVYFGQEVGEPGAGSEGFGQDDGRTTMFDYWGVPEHQKWVNNHAYDGGGLSLEQKQLRIFYSDLLNLARTSPAIAQGAYEDLTSELRKTGAIQDDRVQVFARYFESDRLVIVSSFSDKPAHLRIAIPPALAEKMGLLGDNTWNGRDLLGSGTDVALSKDFVFEVDVQPFGYYIFKFK
ncbi:MAG: alpha-amylase family protein [Cyclobacteriaceae bacterium]